MRTKEVLVLFFVFLSGLAQAATPLKDNTLMWAGCGITKKAFMKELAKAYELNGQPKKSLEILDRIMHFYPATKHKDEVQNSFSDKQNISLRQRVEPKTLFMIRVRKH